METKKYEIFLDDYYKKMSKNINDIYEEKLSLFYENSDYNKLQKSIQEIVKREYELNIDTCDFTSKELKDKKLKIVIRHADICDEDNETVELEYSKNDIEILKSLAEEKEKETLKLIDFVEEIKMLLCTVSCEKDFKELLELKGILNKGGDILYGSYLRTEHI